MKTIQIDGQPWLVKSKTSSKIILIPDSSPLRRWRREKKLTTRAAAEILGLSCGQISKIESGGRGISVEILSRLI